MIYFMTKIEIGYISNKYTSKFQGEITKNRDVTWSAVYLKDSISQQEIIIIKMP